jgi:Protein of unknown function (DUF3142)
LTIACALAAIGCGAPASATLEQDAYVWQRNWTEPVRAAVASAPAALGGLRVLVADVGKGDRSLAILPIDPAALREAHRPITLVVRVDGAQPIAELSLAPALAAAQAWGVPIAGLEVDHDCATARLADYAAWLHAQRPPGVRFSITALPAWAASPALAELAATVDELVVQVHAVRAPTIFDPVAARRGLVAFAGAVPAARLRVALPTYSASVHGELLTVDPAVVGAFVDELKRSPVSGVIGIVWFRLPVAGDDQTWSSATFAGVIGAPVSAGVRVTLRDRGDDRVDIIATNSSQAPAELPSVRLDGAVIAAELVSGYQPRGDRLWAAPHHQLAAGASQAIGWARGKALHVATD